MGRIHVLPCQVADRIAAGEVIERPASVVRELVDNAIDADATRIDIILEGGGRDLIAVTDDGVGMDAEDALLAFERHATSKITTGDDLDAVKTLGFRGEALAAIAAVSRVELLTSTADGGSGMRVVVERGLRHLAEPAARARGTSLEVRDLFIAIPARRKFLKTAETELDHCLKAVTRAALARPEIGFRVAQGTRTLLSSAPSRDWTSRVADLLGSRTSSALVEAFADGGAISLRGMVGRADLHRGNREGIFVFVNRRPVRDPLLQRALYDAYRPVLPAGRFPVAVLHIDLPPEHVDVNVHPAKAEVRFHRPHEIRALVVGGIQRALGGRAAIPVFRPSAEPAQSGAFGPRGQGSLAGLLANARPVPSVDGPAPPPWTALRDAPPAADGAPGGGAIPRPLAQYRLCYIVAEDERGLLVVDQHVAHERILYEELSRQAADGPLARQLLLFPEPVDLGAADGEFVRAQAELLGRLGFGFEPFGTGTVLVREVPAVYGRRGRATALAELVGTLRERGEAEAQDLFSRVIATVACHSAVRKGMALGPGQMSYLLRGLACCEVPSHCPHGRVISIRVDLGALDRTFDRA